MASGLNLTVNERNPIVEGEFPLDGSRFEGTFPPIVGRPFVLSSQKGQSGVYTPRILGLRLHHGAGN